MKYTHLTMEERYQIDDLRREGFSQKKIAEQLKRSPSTLSREMRRNKGDRVWRACQAHGKALTRLTERAKKNVRKINEEAREEAITKLIDYQWSPEQISGWFKLKGKPGISHESIYQYILTDKREGGTLHTHLRCQKKRRRRYGSCGKGKPKIRNRMDIKERPKIVEKRLRIGDWEGDTIIGLGCKGAIVSSVERVSRFTILGKVKTKSPEGVSKKIIKALRHFKKLAYTMTLDNGGEFSLHEKIAHELDMKIYFATPYCSWERGTNENTNGLVRQYFKKSMNFNAITDKDVRLIQDKLNHRPRKCLGYKTPHEVFNEQCKKKGIALRV